MTAPDFTDSPSSQIGLRKPCEELRNKIRDIGDEVQVLKAGPVHQISDNDDRIEAIANAQLAFRHLEDARMRLGKVLQAADGGISIFDLPKSTPAA